VEAHADPYMADSYAGTKAGAHMKKWNRFKNLSTQILKALVRNALHLKLKLKTRIIGLNNFKY